MTKMIVNILFVVAFAIFLFPVGTPLISLLIALCTIYVLVTLVPSFIVLWNGLEQKNFFTRKRTLHTINIFIACVGIALSVAAIVMPPLAIAGLAVLGLSIVFSKFVMPRLLVDGPEKISDNDQSKKSTESGAPLLDDTPQKVTTVRQRMLS